MTRDEILAICLNLPGAEETYPFGEEVAVIKVGGKMFALAPLFGEPGSVNFKCDPAQAIELREAYPGIRPGYHQNKRHWNTVHLDGSVEDVVQHERLPSRLTARRSHRRRLAGNRPRQHLSESPQTVSLPARSTSRPRGR